MVPLLNWIWTIVNCNEMLNFTRLSNVYVEEGRGNEGSPFSFPQLLSSLSDSSVHGIPQARILEWVAISFSRGSPLPMAWTPVSCISGIFFTIWATRQAHQIKWGRFITTGHEQKNRGKIEASQVSRTKPEQKPGTEKGQRWCSLRESPRMDRAPSRHGLELSNVRNPPHNQSHFPSGKDGVFFILWVLPGAQFSRPWKAGGARKFYWGFVKCMCTLQEPRMWQSRIRTVPNRIVRSMLVALRNLTWCYIFSQRSIR